MLNKVKINNKTKVKKGLINIRTFKKFDEHFKVDIINVMNAKVKAGWQIYSSDLLSKYYDKNVLLNSPIFDDNVSKQFIFEFFRDLLLESNFTAVEQIALAKGLEDINGSCLVYRLGEGDDLPVDFIAQWNLKTYEMLTDLFLTQVDVSGSYSKYLIDACKKDVTLGNFLYLLKFDN